MAIGRCKPEMTPAEASRAAHEAFDREGWSNAKISAGLDAMLGPVTLK